MFGLFYSFTIHHLCYLFIESSGIESELKAEFLSMANNMQFDLLEQEDFFEEEVQVSGDPITQDQNSENSDT